MNDKKIAQRTLPYQRGDVHGVESADRLICKCQSIARNSRHPNKACERALKEYCRKLERNNHTSHSPSDDDVAGGA